MPPPALAEPNTAGIADRDADASGRDRAAGVVDDGPAECLTVDGNAGTSANQTAIADTAGESSGQILDACVAGRDGPAGGVDDAAVESLPIYVNACAARRDGARIADAAPERGGAGGDAGSVSGDCT